MVAGAGTQPDRRRLMLIDGHALAYRAYHAIPPLTSPAGEPTNAIFGFANILLKAIQDYDPDYVITTFDVGRTFRHDEYEEYKAKRAKTPDDMRPQLPWIKKLVAALGIPIHQVEGYEADDLLGTLSLQATRLGLETIIVSGDTDTFQLISPTVQVLYPRRQFRDTKLYDEEAVRERYDLEPGQLIDLKALMGDSSDNIPGVRGVGDKTATRLLKQYGSVEAIYEHLDQVTQSRFRQALERGRDAAVMSKYLVTIVRDVDITLDLAASKWPRFERAEVMELLRELGFGSLVSRIPRPETTGEAAQLGFFAQPGAATGREPALGPSEVDYRVVDSKESLDRLVAHLRETELFALDTETTHTDPMRARLVGISISDTPGTAHYLPVGHDPRLSQGQQLPLELVRARLGPVLADASVGKVCHNANYDLRVLALHDMPLEGLQFETMIAAWLLEPTGRGIGLKNQAWQRLGVEMTPIEELIGKGRNQISMDLVPIPRVAPYACADADMTLRLVDVLSSDLKERDQWELFAGMEMPLVPVLVDMEMHGMLVDRAYLQAMSEEITQRLDELGSQIHALAGHPFNINSTRQLGRVLFEELNLPVIRRTRTGYSTDAAVMDKLHDEHPIVDLVLEYRKLEKLKGTYVDALPRLIHPRTGRVHTSFRQTGTTTGRISSNDPNLQNIPVRTELGRRVRGAFIAPAGHMLLSCDYSQVELRLLAHLSQDPELMAAFRRDEDIHATTAATIHDVPLAEVTKEQRALAKTINFGLMYGMGAYGLAARTDLSVPQAREFIASYFGRFSRVREYLEETKRMAREKGYVETILGRRRYFPELQSRSAAGGNLRRGAERAAVNMPIQGSAADIIKLAMIALQRRLHEQGLAAQLVLQVHDELVLEVREDAIEATRALVVDSMESAYKLRVPLKVDTAIGKNWMEMK